MSGRSNRSARVVLCDDVSWSEPTPRRPRQGVDLDPPSRIANEWSDEARQNDLTRVQGYLDDDDRRSVDMIRDVRELSEDDLRDSARTVIRRDGRRAGGARPLRSDAGPGSRERRPGFALEDPWDRVDDERDRVERRPGRIDGERDRAGRVDGDEVARRFVRAGDDEAARRPGRSAQAPARVAGGSRVDSWLEGFSEEQTSGGVEPVADVVSNIAHDEQVWGPRPRLMASEAGGRRTVVITGHGGDRHLPQRSPARESALTRSGFTADRTAMWAVLLCVILLLVALSSH